MTTMRTLIFILAFLAAASLTAFAAAEESVDVLIARAESAPPNDRPALYLKIADLKAKAADQLYNDGNADAGRAALKDVVAYSKKATDASVATGKKLKNVEITLRKMAEKFRDIKRTVAFDDQAPLQQAVDDLEKMRTDLLSAMFGKKKGK
ncbi:MAG: hypothetical protein WBQ64_07000 [Terriglobales bacterium]|jgi:hypothetical protein